MKLAQNGERESSISCGVHSSSAPRHPAASRRAAHEWPRGERNTPSDTVIAKSKVCTTEGPAAASRSKRNPQTHIYLSSRGSGAQGCRTRGDRRSRRPGYRRTGSAHALALDPAGLLAALREAGGGRSTCSASAVWLEEPEVSDLVAPIRRCSTIPPRAPSSCACSPARARRIGVGRPCTPSRGRRERVWLREPRTPRRSGRSRPEVVGATAAPRWRAGDGVRSSTRSTSFPRRKIIRVNCSASAIERIARWERPGRCLRPCVAQPSPARLSSPSSTELHSTSRFAANPYPACSATPRAQPSSRARRLPRAAPTNATLGGFLSWHAGGRVARQPLAPLGKTPPGTCRCSAYPQDAKASSGIT